MTKVLSTQNNKVIIANNKAFSKPPLDLENITITPTISQQTFDHPNKDGYDEIIVNGVTSSIDNNIQASNIKKDVSILGVVGTLETGSDFTGHCDATGLATIGWTQEDIQFYQDNGILWDEEFDNSFKLTASELAGDNTPNTRFIPKNTTVTNFSGYTKLLAIPIINLGSITSVNSIMSSTLIKSFPLIDTSNITNFSRMFYQCKFLENIANIDTSSGTDFSYMFYLCYLLRKLPSLNLENAMYLSSFLYGCKNLIKFKDFNTSKVAFFDGCFNGCTSLIEVGELDCSSAEYIYNMFSGCSSLMNLGGFKDLGKAYPTSASTSRDYTLSISEARSLTEQSLINVLTKVYDIASKGVATQNIQLGSTNLAKLTSVEGQQAIASAQAKGWTIS